MLQINTGVGGIITNNFIDNPQNGDVMMYDSATEMWKNFASAYLSGVIHDATLTGDGTLANPLSVVDPFTGVIHDATLTGDGKTTQLSVVSTFTGVTTDATLTGVGTLINPLKVASPWGGVIRDATLTGDGKTTNLSVVDPYTGVIHDTTLTGDGKTTNLSVVDPFTGVSHDATLSGDGKTTNLSVVDPYTGVIHDTTLTGDGKTTNLSVVDPYTGVTHDATLTGDGKTTNLSVVDPYTGVIHDATMTGDGKTVNLSVVDPFTGVLTDATLTGNGKTTALSVVGGAALVTTDGVTIQGDGAPATPIALKQVQVTATDLSGFGVVGNTLQLATYGTAQTRYSPKVTTDTKGRTTTANFSSETDVYDSFSFVGANAANTNINYSAGIVSFPNIAPSVNGWVASTGTFTCVQPGWYSISLLVDYNAGASGYRQCQIVQNPLGAVANVVIGESANFNVSAGYRTCANCFANTYLNAGDTIRTMYYQNSGGTLVVRGYFSCVLIHV